MRTPPVQAAISVVRKVWYAGRDERLEVAGHTLKYLPGTRPVRPSYRDDPDVVVRNDARQLEYFANNVKRGETIIDVGGNVGQYAVLFGTIVGDSGHVISFEPDREARGLMEQNLEINRLGSRVTVEPLALFDTRGTHNFYSRPGDSMGSLERAGFGSNAGLTDIQESVVHTVPLDDYLVSNGLSDPDWVKIDAEGAEINVLRGGSRALHGKTTIVCELHPYAWDSFGTSWDELVSIVTQAGRRMTWLDDTREFTGRPDYGAVVISW
jgi:FkbM family methyltransferase